MRLPLPVAALAVEELPPPPGVCRLLRRGTTAVQQQVHQGEGRKLACRGGKRAEHLQGWSGPVAGSSLSARPPITSKPPQAHTQTACADRTPDSVPTASRGSLHRPICWRLSWRWPGILLPTCGCTWRAHCLVSRLWWACRMTCTCWSCSIGGCWGGTGVACGCKQGRTAGDEALWPSADQHQGLCAGHSVSWLGGALDTSVVSSFAPLSPGLTAAP